jgi:hypothetical protein
MVEWGPVLSAEQDRDALAMDEGVVYRIPMSA